MSLSSTASVCRGPAMHLAAGAGTYAKHPPGVFRFSASFPPFESLSGRANPPVLREAWFPYRNLDRGARQAVPCAPPLQPRSSCAARHWTSHTPSITLAASGLGLWERDGAIDEPCRLDGLVVSDLDDASHLTRTMHVTNTLYRILCHLTTARACWY